jgi:hypothetical protein
MIPPPKTDFDAKSWVQVNGQWVPRQYLDALMMQAPQPLATAMRGMYEPQGRQQSQTKIDRREKKDWAKIDISWLPGCQDMATFPAGFKVSVYDGRLTSYFEIPSEWVVPTHGGMRYIEYFNETGPYSRFRFQLCHNFLNGRCTKGFTCTYIHAKELPKAHGIHVQGMDAYERLPAGLSLFVNMPGSTEEPQLIPSQHVIRTLGAERLYTDVIENKQSAVVRPQHCAHFLYKKLCNRGAECAFIHALLSNAACPATAKKKFDPMPH